MKPYTHSLDADLTFNGGWPHDLIVLSGAISANRTLVLEGGGAQEGEELIVLRSASPAGDFIWTVASGGATLCRFAAGVTGSARFKFDSQRWVFCGGDGLIETANGYAAQAIADADIDLALNAMTVHAVNAVELTADRAVGLPTTGARKGMMAYVSRLAATPGAFTLTVKSGTAAAGDAIATMVASKKGFALCRFNGTAWECVGGTNLSEFA